MSCKHGHDVAAVLSRAQLCVQHVDTDQLLSTTRGYLARHVGILISCLARHVDIWQDTWIFGKTRGYMARHVDALQDMLLSISRIARQVDIEQLLFKTFG